MNYIRLIINMVAIGGVFFLLAKFSRYWRRINPPNPILYKRIDEYSPIPRLDPEPEIENTKTAPKVNQQRYTCPCCGYKTFNDKPGSYDTCHVCFWKDDKKQLLDPWLSDGANGISLFDAQTHYMLSGVCNEAFEKFVTDVPPSDDQDPDWIIVTEDDKVNFKDLDSIKDSSDYRDWYYWVRIIRAKTTSLSHSNYAHEQVVHDILFMEIIEKLKIREAIFNKYRPRDKDNFEKYILTLNAIQDKGTLRKYFDSLPRQYYDDYICKGNGDIVDDEKRANEELMDATKIFFEKVNQYCTAHGMKD